MRVRAPLALCMAGLVGEMRLARAGYSSFSIIWSPVTSEFPTELQCTTNVCFIYRSTVYSECVFHVPNCMY
jgi:hypothetical protein